MTINITARKTSVKDSFKERVEKKMSKLAKFFDDEAIASVVVTNEHDRETVEITIHSNGMVFRAEKTTADRLDSLEGVTDSLLKQITRNKAKLQKKFKSPGIEKAFAAYEDAYTEEYHVVRTKKFTLKPMDVEEAILQMNMVGHEFFMFRNSESGEINVVYRRNDGNYGLLEPENL